MTVKRAVLIGVSCLGLACAGQGGARLGSVTPANAQLRHAAALMAAGRCDSAVVVARSGQLLAPADPLGPLVLGGCQEKDGRYDLAFATYTDFAGQHPQARGVSAVRAKALLALRAQSEQTARQALASESTLTSLPPEPSTLAVLPVTISAGGDSTFQPLSRGLAELITSDLALVRTLRLLERVQIGALLDELKLGQSQRGDPNTAARVGRLLRAERMVQGVASITMNGPVRLTAAPAEPVITDAFLDEAWGRDGALGRGGERHIQSAARPREAARLQSGDAAGDPVDRRRTAVAQRLSSPRTRNGGARCRRRNARVARRRDPRHARHCR